MGFLHLTPSTIQETFGYENHVLNPRLNCFKPHSKKTEQTFAQEISSSLTGDSKSISPKYFYDDKGSQLFEKICELPEYYLTRTEIKILNQIQNDLKSYLTENMRLVELGSGSSIKTRLILDVFDKIQSKIEYFPIDISDILKDGCQQLLDDYEKLHVTGIIDTYHGGLEFIKNFDDTPNLIAFLGSSFGNFSETDGNNFLKQINSSMKDSDYFLIGLDLVKEKEILENAYDDTKGITAKFNLNVLSRINEELDGNFDLDNFSHHAIFNESEQRIEMYLKSSSNHSVTIPKSNLKIDFQEDELIHTEHSHKYTIPQIEKMLENAGFDINRIWQDEKRHYALILCSKN